MNVSFTMSYTFTLSIYERYIQGFYSTDQYYCRYREHEIDLQSINSSEKKHSSCRNTLDGFSNQIIRRETIINDAHSCSTLLRTGF